MLYSLVHINETSPYEVFAYKEDTVYFITDDGSEYLVGFIEETNIGIQRAYQFDDFRRFSKDGYPCFDDPRR